MQDVVFLMLASLAVVGLAMLFFEPISVIIGKDFKQFMVAHKKQKAKEMKKTEFEKHLQKLLSATSNSNKGIGYEVFLGISIAAFILTYLLLLWVGLGGQAGIFAIVMGILPYLLMRIRLGKQRNTGSYEGELLIRELEKVYKIQYYNIIETIDRTIPELEKAPISRRALFRLSLRLKTYRTEAELQEALDEFVFAIGTSWAQMLANNLYSAIAEDMNISAGLAHLRDGCRVAATRIEQGKRENAEGFAIVKYLAPILYVGLIFVAINMMDISLADVFRYQFRTAQGIQLLLWIGLATIGNLGIIAIISKPKFDV